MTLKLIPEDPAVEDLDNYSKIDDFLIPELEKKYKL
jgi:hypothetical protein